MANFRHPFLWENTRVSLWRPLYLGIFVCILKAQNPVLCAGPVSYTHLDVYKRQPYEEVRYAGRVPAPETEQRLCADVETVFSKIRH